MNQSSTETTDSADFPWCAGHPNNGDLCKSRMWEVAGMQLFLYGHSDDRPPVVASVRVPTRAAGYTMAELSRLGGALSALAMLGHHTDPSGTDYWTGRLDSLRDRETAS